MAQRGNPPHGFRYNSPVPDPAPSLLHRFASRLVLLHPKEAKPLLLSALYYFLVLFSNSLLRPIRDTFGIRGDLDKLPWLWTATVTAMLIAAPLYSFLVSRAPRRSFIPLTYLFFAANMLAFYAAMLAPGVGSSIRIGYAFYVWVSVFNLFAVSIFWGLMADIFSPEQGKRLFASIAVGGTLGAIAGNTTPSLLARTLGAVHLIPLSAAILAPVIWIAWQLLKSQAASEGNQPPRLREPSPRPLEGFVLIGRSRYLQLMAVLMLLFTLTSTFFEFEKLRLVKEVFDSDDARTQAFATLDLAANILCVITQVFFTGRLVRWLGVGAGLAIIPLITAAGFAAMWAAPTLGIPAFGAFSVFYVLRRGLHFAVDKPSREMLYTPLGPDEKYKSKSFIDTFVYRSGDLLGIWTRLIPFVAAHITPIAIGVCGAWLAVAAGLTVINRRISHRPGSMDGPR